MRDFNAMPKGLSAKGKRAYHAIMAFLKERGLTDTGGCQTFYSPQEWAERGEQYCTRALLIVVYDGGMVRPCFNLDEGYVLYEAMQEALHKVGFWSEAGTGWYSGIYEE